MASSKATDAFSQFDALSGKRLALESLISIAIGIQGQQQAMGDLSLIARPSQQLPGKIVLRVQAFESKYANFAEEELRQWLASIEQIISRILGQVAAFAVLDLDQLRAREEQEDSTATFQDLVAEFERHTHTSLGLRSLLKKRGVVLAPFKLPFSQEAIAERIETLREQEGQCIRQITAEAQSIIDDSQLLLANPGLSDRMQDELLNVVQAMQENVSHLDAGGRVSEIPHKFEVIVVRARPEPKADLSPKATEAPVRTAPRASEEGASSPGDATPVEKPKRLTGFQLFIKWLMTPWGKTWKALKEENERL